MKLTIHDVAYYGLAAVGAGVGLAMAPVIMALGWSAVSYFTIAMIVGAAAAAIPFFGGVIATGEPNVKTAIGIGVLSGAASLYVLPQFIAPVLSTFIALPLIGGAIGSSIGYKLDEENEDFKDFIKSTRAKLGEKVPFLKEGPQFETKRQYGIMNDPSPEKGGRKFRDEYPPTRWPSYEDDMASFSDPLHKDWQRAGDPDWKPLEQDYGKQVEILPPRWHRAPPTADYEQ